MSIFLQSLAYYKVYFSTKSIFLQIIGPQSLVLQSLALQSLILQAFVLHSRVTQILVLQSLVLQGLVLQNIVLLSLVLQSPAKNKRASRAKVQSNPLKLKYYATIFPWINCWEYCLFRIRMLLQSSVPILSWARIMNAWPTHTIHTNMKIMLERRIDSCRKFQRNWCEKDTVIFTVYSFFLGISTTSVILSNSSLRPRTRSWLYFCK